MKLSGRADRTLIPWLDSILALLRVLPRGWRADLRLERDPDPPDEMQD